MTELRAYFFGNMYLSSIQQGIQAAHVIHDLFLKYGVTKPGNELLWDWAAKHKTVVLLNAGYAEEISSLIRFFDNSENDFPWQFFREEEAALNAALTSIGIILPEKIYKTAEFIRRRTFDTDRRQPNTYERIMQTGELHVPAAYHSGMEDVVWTYTKFELDLAVRLNDYSLAR